MPELSLIIIKLMKSDIRSLKGDPQFAATAHSLGVLIDFNYIKSYLDSWVDLAALGWNEKNIWSNMSQNLDLQKKIFNMF